MPRITVTTFSSIRNVRLSEVLDSIEDESNPWGKRHYDFQSRLMICVHLLKSIELLLRKPDEKHVYVLHPHYVQVDTTSLSCFVFAYREKSVSVRIKNYLPHESETKNDQLVTYMYSFAILVARLFGCSEKQIANKRFGGLFSTVNEAIDSDAENNIRKFIKRNIHDNPKKRDHSISDLKVMFENILIQVQHNSSIYNSGLTVDSVTHYSDDSASAGQQVTRSCRC